VTYPDIGKGILLSSLYGNGKVYVKLRVRDKEETVEDRHGRVPRCKKEGGLCAALFLLHCKSVANYFTLLVTTTPAVPLVPAPVAKGEPARAVSEPSELIL
jgi:hypothetical protein